jgi:hypothetical protein
MITNGGAELMPNFGSLGFVSRTYPTGIRKRLKKRRKEICLSSDNDEPMLTQKSRRIRKRAVKARKTIVQEFSSSAYPSSDSDYEDRLNKGLKRALSLTETSVHTMCKNLSSLKEFISNDLVVEFEEIYKQSITLENEGKQFSNKLFTTNHIKTFFMIKESLSEQKLNIPLDHLKAVDIFFHDMLYLTNSLFEESFDNIYKKMKLLEVTDVEMNIDN